MRPFRASISTPCLGAATAIRSAPASVSAVRGTFVASSGERRLTK